jgi:6-phosphofructokinase 1
MDTETGRGRQRFVDVETESYRVARDYMVRIGARDFLDETWITKLAEAGGLTQSEFISRFGKYSHS